MRRKPERKGTAFSLMLLGVVSALTIPCPTPAVGSEPLGDLELRLTLVELTTTTAADGSDAGGLARIEVTLEAALPARGIRLRVLRPDGTGWIVDGKPYDPGQPVWTRVGGDEPPDTVDGGPSVGPREAIRTVIEVPVSGAAVHEVVVEILGQGARGPLRTENVVRVALGVPETDVEDDGEYASFPVGVRP